MTPKSERGAREEHHSEFSRRIRLSTFWVGRLVVGLWVHFCHLLMVSDASAGSQVRGRGQASGPSRLSYELANVARLFQIFEDLEA